MPKMPARRADGVITLAYGTEADQAFMVYALAAGKVDTEDRRYELVRREVQELDAEAENGTYDVTAIGFGAYPRIRARYLVLACGGSYGDHQGPLLVARKPIRAGEVEGLAVGVPGEHSAAAMALRLWLPRAELDLQPMPTREISLRVRAGLVRSGLLVNEDQITYRNHNLMAVVDLGHWWGEKTEGLPLALGTNVIRRDIPEEQRIKIALDLKRSIAYALGHREEALDWTLERARNPDRETLDRYIERYVNDLSLDCGERGRQAARLLFREAHRHGIVDQLLEPVFHGDEEQDAKKKK
jgi:1,4-dihydroxy-6-naphthoate synthase